jgi:hypothetical protein
LVPARAAEPHPDPIVSFLAVGDWGRDGAFHQAEVAARMGETAKALDAAFVISVGDNFYEDGVASIDDPKWKTSFEDVYTAPSLQIPWYVALGNHDYHGNTQAQLDYAQASKRWNMLGRWYGSRQTSVTSKGRVGVDLFVLDTSPFIAAYHADGAKKVKVAGQRTAPQLRWLDAALAQSTADWKVVVGHHPIYSGGAHGAPGGSPELMARLDPILQRHRIPLYLRVTSTTCSTSSAAPRTMSAPAPAPWPVNIATAQVATFARCSPASPPARRRATDSTWWRLRGRPSGRSARTLRWGQARTRQGLPGRGIYERAAPPVADGARPRGRDRWRLHRGARSGAPGRPTGQ